MAGRLGVVATIQDMAPAGDAPPLDARSTTTHGPGAHEVAETLWGHVTSRTRAWMALHIVGVIGGGLALDRWLGWPGQHLATLWTVAVFAWLVRLGRPFERRALLVCTALAGTGEAVLSLGWGIYDYQFGNLPLFVPPGHALLMTLGVLVRPFVRTGYVRGVALAAASWALWAAWHGTDEFGAVLTLLFLGCAAVSRGRDLYAAMLVLALLMELYGTALGNWAWRPVVPGTGWSAANPPFAAGAFYALLDLLVLTAIHRRPRPSRDPKPVAVSVAVSGAAGDRAPRPVRSSVVR